VLNAATARREPRLEGASRSATASSCSTEWSRAGPYRTWVCG